MKFRKKQIVILAAVAVICVSVYLNWRFNGAAGELPITDTVEAGRNMGQAQLVSSDGALMTMNDLADIPVTLPTEVPVGIDANPVLPGDLDADPVSDTDAMAQSSYFAEARMERQQSRDEALELLKEIANNTENSQEARNKAAADMGVIALHIERESNIETILKSKGFDDCVAVLSESSIYLMVKTPGLMDFEVAQIREVVLTETGLTAEAIKIIEVK